MAEPSEKLFNEVLADARAKAEEIRRRGRQEVEELKKKTADEIRATGGQIQATAESRAATKRGEILASVAVEAQRDRLARTEAVLQSVHDGVRRQLAAISEGDSRRSQTLLALEAIAQLPPDVPVEVALPAAAHSSFGPQLVQEIMKQAAALKRPVTARLAAQAAPIVTGVVVRTADGRLEVVNSLEERLRRLWPELRLQVAPGLWPAEAQSKEK